MSSRRDIKWPMCPIGDLLETIIDYRGKTPPKSTSGIPLISAANVKAGRLVMDSPEYISLADYERWTTRGFTEPGDILITTEAPAGEVAPYPRNGTYQISRRVMALRPRRTELDPGFLLYALQWSETKERLLSFSRGTTVPRVLKTDITGLPIPCPPLSEQKTVAHILGTLDDKIELNRRMSRTLEGVARAVFKSWFVDFDPVRAKAAVRRQHPKWTNAQVSRAACPKMKPEIAELFPDSFQDSELDKIPKEWRVGILRDVIELNPPRRLRRGEVAPYLGMANMPTRRHSPDKVMPRAFGSGSRFINGDTLLARITPCLENGKTAYVDFMEEGQVGWGSTEFIVLRPKPPLPSQYAYCLARSPEFREFAIQSMTGSSGRQRVPIDALAQFPLVTVPEPIAKRFGQLVEPLFARACRVIRESRTLAALRDTLLPKLLSGQLRVKDAERIIERAV